MNFLEGNVRRKVLSSVSWVLFLGLPPAAHTKTCTLYCLKPIQKKKFSNVILSCAIQNPLKCKTVWELNGPFAIMHHEQTVWICHRKAGHSFLAVYRPLISWHLDVKSCPQDVCLPTGSDDKCPTSPYVCTFGHESIKGLIAQLPYSTCPLDILLQLEVFIPPQPLVHRHKRPVDTPSTVGW